MDAGLMHWAVIIVLLVHGVGHVMGFLAAWTDVPMGFTNAPWILSDVVSVQSTVGRVFGLLWLVALAGFLGGAFGLILRQPWWPALIIAASVVSIVVIVPWWNTVTAGARFGALAVDVLAIALLLPAWGGDFIQRIS